MGLLSLFLVPHHRVAIISTTISEPLEWCVTVCLRKIIGGPAHQSYERWKRNSAFLQILKSYIEPEICQWVSILHKNLAIGFFESSHCRNQVFLRYRWVGFQANEMVIQREYTVLVTTICGSDHWPNSLQLCLRYSSDFCDSRHSHIVRRSY